jgi:Rrf2 family protein
MTGAESEAITRVRGRRALTGETPYRHYRTMLSTTTEYALRAIVALARCPEGRSCLGRDIAENTGVPSNYLSKILLDLKTQGLVSAVRGTGGGYRLRRPAEEISLMDVVEIFDPARARPRCLLYRDEECSSETACSAHSRWGEVRDAWIAFLEDSTIAEIAVEEEKRGPLKILR